MDIPYFWLVVVALAVVAFIVVLAVLLSSTPNNDIVVVADPLGGNSIRTVVPNFVISSDISQFIKYFTPGVSLTETGIIFHTEVKVVKPEQFTTQWTFKTTYNSVISSSNTFDITKTSNVAIGDSNLYVVINASAIYEDKNTDGSVKFPYFWIDSTSDWSGSTNFIPEGDPGSENNVYATISVYDSNGELLQTINNVPVSVVPYYLFSEGKTSRQLSLELDPIQESFYPTIILKAAADALKNIPGFATATVKLSNDIIIHTQTTVSQLKSETTENQEVSLSADSISTTVENDGGLLTVDTGLQGDENVVFSNRIITQQNGTEVQTSTMSPPVQTFGVDVDITGSISNWEGDQTQVIIEGLLPINPLVSQLPEEMEIPLTEDTLLSIIPPSIQGVDLYDLAGNKIEPSSELQDLLDNVNVIFEITSPIGASSRGGNTFLQQLFTPRNLILYSIKFTTFNLSRNIVFEISKIPSLSSGFRLIPALAALEDIRLTITNNIFVCGGN